MTSHVKYVQFYPKYLWFLILSYTMVITLANWFDPRLIHIFGLDTDAGTIIFPLTFLLSDLITEVYGYKLARRAIWCGFLFNLFFILFGQLIIHLPSPSFAQHNDSFDALHAANVRIILASIVSYFCSEPLNSIIMAKLKIKLEGKYLSLRFIMSTVMASGIDSLIFTACAFYGTMSDPSLIQMMLNMWFIKVIIEVVGLPFSVSLAQKLKCIEQCDVYDRRTRFHIFSLETEYATRDNEYSHRRLS